MRETDTLEILDGSGHLALSWDPSNPEEVAHARAEIEQLKAAGYSFFAVVGPAEGDEIARGNGRLIVERIADPTRPRETEAAQPIEDTPPPRRKGQRSVAVRPLRGG